MTRAPENPRYAYVYGVALNSLGRHAEAAKALEPAQRRFTGDRDILVALVQSSMESGDRSAAERWTAKLRDLDAGGGARADGHAPTAAER